MPANKARAMLQRHSPDINVRSNGLAETGFFLMIPDPGIQDQIEVFLTLTPNDPAVWMIKRSQNISPTKPMSTNAMLGALREKYGKETATQDRGGGGLFLYWIFDQSGWLLPSADPALLGCKGSTFTTNMRTGPPQSPNMIERACYAAFFAVTATFASRDGQLLEGYSVELVNLPYAVRAATVTANDNGAAADRAHQDQVNKANQNKPKF
jgi:hypothetical protein